MKLSRGNCFFVSIVFELGRGGSWWHFSVFLKHNLFRSLWSISLRLSYIHHWSFFLSKPSWSWEDLSSWNSLFLLLSYFCYSVLLCISSHYFDLALFRRLSTSKGRRRCLECYIPWNGLIWSFLEWKSLALKCLLRVRSSMALWNHS